MKSISLNKLASTLTLILVLVFSQSVLALPEDHKKAIDENSVHKFLPAIGGECSVSGGSTVRLTGNSNVAKAFNYFVNDIKLTPDQAAGIVGNLIGESRVMPDRKQGNGTLTIQSIKEIVGEQGFGIAQWTSRGRQNNWIGLAAEKAGIKKRGDISQYTDEEAKKISPIALSMELQLEYLVQELNTVPGYGFSEIKKAQDVRQATWVFLVFFERPAATSGFEENPVQATGGSAKEALDERTGFAQGVLNGDTSGNGAPSSSATPSSGDCETASSGNIGGPLAGDSEEPDYSSRPDIQYDGPPPGAHTPSNCTSGHTVGAKSLGEVVMDNYSPPVTLVDGFSCRQNTNDSTTSIHGVGRALDIMIDGTTPQGKQVGDKIRNFMINNAKQLGIQVVIWDRHIWSVNNDGWRDYTGPNPHIDHLHVEVNLEASKNPNLGKE